MIGNLVESLETTLRDTLPGLFDGEPPSVQLAVASTQFEIDQESADAIAGEPRQDDRTDDLPFDAGRPAGPYTLTQPPYPGPRHVRLTMELGDRILLREDEVVWDEVDTRVFTLNLRPHREVAGVTGVQVLYGVTAVFTKIKAVQTLTVQLQSADTDDAERAEALVVAVIALNRQHLVDSAQTMYEDGDYRAQIEIKGLQLLSGVTSGANQRVLTLEAAIELKASRALREDEGRPIERIRTPGRPVAPDRPIDIHIEVDV